MNTLLRLIHKIALIGIVVTLIGCDLEGENTPGVYYTDFVTTHVNLDKTLYFEHVLRNDLGSVLLDPNPDIKADLYEGQRVILQYYVNEEKPDNSKEVEVIEIYSVRHDTINDVHPDTLAAYPNDPLKISISTSLTDWTFLAIPCKPQATQSMLYCATTATMMCLDIGLLLMHLFIYPTWRATKPCACMPIPPMTRWVTLSSISKINY